MKIPRLLSIVLVLLSAPINPARSEDMVGVFARDAARTVDLSRFAGKSYLLTMRNPRGINAAMQTDDITPVTIAKPAEITAAVAMFDPSLATNLYGEFVDGESDFAAIIGHIQGQSLSPREIRSALSPFITHLKSPTRANLALDRAYGVALLASSSGTLVRINSESAFYNVAYHSPIVQSGRSYGMAPGRKLLDQSDSGYLTELGAYLKAATPMDATNLNTAILKLLTQSNSAGLADLPSAGQIAITDFLTIYTAELIRHNMVNLAMNRDTWEVDLGEVTLLANYCAPTGMVMKKGKLIAGSMNSYGYGGIGNHRKDFAALAKGIESFERANHPNLILVMEQLTPIPDQQIANAVKDDIFRRLLVYLNLPEVQRKLQEDATHLVVAMSSLLHQVRLDGNKITSSIQLNARSTDAAANRQPVRGFPPPLVWRIVSR
jgi:hypothetical protein